MGKNLTFSHKSAALMCMLFLMPIDWFSVTGLIFREAGAKPMNLFSAAWMLLLWVMGRDVWSARVNSRISMHLILALIVLWGGFTFLIGTLIFPFPPASDRSSVNQFLSQTAMLLLFMVVLQSQIYLFQSQRVRAQVLVLLPWAASVHLLFFLAEHIGFFSADFPGLLAMFRNENGLIDRASGLMSEPSYFGVFAALYALPLLLFGGANPRVNRLLAVVILACALLVQSKTIFLVLGGQFIYLMLSKHKTKSLRWSVWLAIFVIVPSGIYMSTTTAALDLEVNLSSIMRLGSNVLAWRVATEGYGLLGVGTGQFHFYYQPYFAPDFLLLSQEALDQMSGISGGRASTFNLPLRLLVEIGVPGLLLAASLMIKVFFTQRRSNDTATQIGLCFVAGSLGFLMTQDSYCLPSLAFGLALAMTGKNPITPSLTPQTT